MSESPGLSNPEQPKPFEYKGVEIPPEFVELFQACFSAFEKIENHFAIELDEGVREGFADEVAQCAETDDVRGVFMSYFNQILEEHEIDMALMDAGDVTLIMGLLEPEA